MSANDVTLLAIFVASWFGAWGFIVGRNLDLLDCYVGH